MEIKTCEEYVLAELEETKASFNKLNYEHESLKKEYKAAVNFLIDSGEKYDFSGRSVILSKTANQDKRISLSYWNEEDSHFKDVFVCKPLLKLKEEEGWN